MLTPQIKKTGKEIIAVLLVRVWHHNNKTINQGIDSYSVNLLVEIEKAKVN